MKKWFQNSFLSVIFILFISPVAAAQLTPIETIINNPSNFEGDEVEIQGLVTQYVVGVGTTNYYIIKGDYGGIIRVNTSEPAPETNAKYKVKGIVYLDRTKKSIVPFISEKVKYLLVYFDPSLSLNPSTIDEGDAATLSWAATDAISVTINGTQAEIKGTKTITGKTNTVFTLQAAYPDGKTKEKSVALTVIAKSNLLLYILIAALVVLIAAFLFFQTRKKEPQVVEPITQPRPVPFAPQSKEPEPTYSTDTEYKTIKIVKSTPQTLKFIPGKLVITDGADRGKEFRVAGFPSPEGFIVTIGRKEVKGERAYAHIQLKEMTVSREQAEIISRDGRLYVKNLSETNFTQLNGVELKLGEMVELKPNAKIRTGEVEFQYIA